MCTCGLNKLDSASNSGATPDRKTPESGSQVIVRDSTYAQSSVERT